MRIMNIAIVGGGGSGIGTEAESGLAPGIGAAPSWIASTMPRSSTSAKPAATSTCVAVLPMKSAIARLSWWK
jgi:hypothetical protein